MGLRSPFLLGSSLYPLNPSILRRGSGSRYRMPGQHASLFSIVGGGAGGVVLLVYLIILICTVPSLLSAALQSFNIWNEPLGCASHGYASRSWCWRNGKCSCRIVTQVHTAGVPSRVGWVGSEELGVAVCKSLFSAGRRGAPSGPCVAPRRRPSPYGATGRGSPRAATLQNAAYPGGERRHCCGSCFT